MLNEKQLRDIKMLQSLCEQNEKIRLKLNWEMLVNRTEKETTDYFYYADNQLIGFLGLYGFGNKVELCGMVHPDYRRKGVFSSLFTNAMEELKNGPMKTILLNAPANSKSAKGFLQTIPCQYELTEYQMKWSEIELFEGTYNGIVIRESTPNDAEIEIQLDIQCFNFPEEEARKYYKRIKNETTQDFFIIEVDKQKVGKIRVQESDDESWIYGFAILPEFQGKGYGRKALNKIIDTEHKRGFSIFLEVEATNIHALRLYESCGFKAYDSQDYYQYQGNL